LKPELSDFEEDQVFQAKDLRGEVAMVMVVASAQNGLATEKFGSQVVDEGL
jgi:hypothetical protein